jgi:hypothetical protein
MKFFCGLVALLITLAGYGQQTTDSIIVLPLKTPLPVDAKKLGEIKSGDNALKINCDYETLVLHAKQKALEMGGNMVKITELLAPNFISKCYAIKADVYLVADLTPYREQKKAWSKMPGDVKNKYATLYIYRPMDNIVPTPFYKLHLDDSDICTVKSKWKDTINVYKEGEITLSAKTEKLAALRLTVKPGGVYYIRCGVVESQFWMSPVIELVDETTGKEEFKKIKGGKTDTDVKYLQEIH